MFDHLNTRIPKRIEQEKEKVSVVLIPLIKKDGKYHILFEIRSNNLSHQPGTAARSARRICRRSTAVTSAPWCAPWPTQAA